MEKLDTESQKNKKPFKEWFQEIDEGLRSKIDIEIKESFDSYVEILGLSSEDLEKSILDVGTGNGSFIYYLRNHLNNDKAYGIDTKIKKEGMPDDDFILVGSGLDLPFEDESFEIVTAKHYLLMFTEYEDKMKKSVLELIRVVKKGGKVIADIKTPESALDDIDWYKKHNEKEDSNPELTKKWYNEKYEGSKKLKTFLEELQKQGYSVKIKTVSPKKNPVYVMTVEK
jgi:ubiquinone/menaquinone biosynthesis C-methylase UbiE